MNYSRIAMLAEMGIEFDDQGLEELDKLDRARLRQIDIDERQAEIKRIATRLRKQRKLQKNAKI